MNNESANSEATVDETPFLPQKRGSVQFLIRRQVQEFCGACKVRYIQKRGRYQVRQSLAKLFERL